MNKAEKILIIMLIVLNLSGAVFLIIEKSNQNISLTGQVVLTREILLSPEEFYFSIKDSIANYTNYYRIFEIDKYSDVSINISSNNIINYTLLPESEIEGYLKNGSFESFSNLNNTLTVEENHNLNSGNYSVIISTSNKPAEITISIKIKELQA